MNTFTFQNYLDLDRIYWSDPDNHKKQRFGQFIINNISDEVANALKKFLGEDYQRLYYTESYDEANDYIVKYLLSI